MLRRLRYAIAALCGVLLAGTVGYMLVERWSLLDSLYMTVITIATVGFREVHPLSHAGQVLTMALIIAGVGALGFSLGTIVEFMVEGHLTGLLEGRRMDKRIAAMSGHHIVAGVGRVGSVVASELSRNELAVVVIDIDPEALSRAREAGLAWIAGDATDEETLKAAGIERAASLVAALDTDADNLFVTVTAKGLKPDLLIVARSTTTNAESKLRRAGADRVLTPTSIGGRRLAAMVIHPDVSEYLDVCTSDDGVDIKLERVTLAPSDPFVGLSIGESRIRSTTGAHVLAVHTVDGRTEDNPSKDLVLRAGDRLVILGTSAQLDSFAARHAR
jgi:voltage-gated potassium channel